MTGNQRNGESSLSTQVDIRGKDHKALSIQLKTCRNLKRGWKEVPPWYERKPNSTVQGLAWQELLDYVLSSTYCCSVSRLPPIPPSLWSTRAAEGGSTGWEKLLPQTHKTNRLRPPPSPLPVHSEKERRKMEGRTEGKRKGGRQKHTGRLPKRQAHLNGERLWGQKQGLKLG